MTPFDLEVGSEGIRLDPKGLRCEEGHWSLTLTWTCPHNVSLTSCDIVMETERVTQVGHQEAWILKEGHSHLELRWHWNYIDPKWNLTSFDLEVLGHRGSSWELTGLNINNRHWSFTLRWPWDGCASCGLEMGSGWALGGLNTKWALIFDIEMERPCSQIMTLTSCDFNDLDLMWPCGGSMRGSG